MNSVNVVRISASVLAGIQLPRAVLVYGPSGTGKTLLVRAVAHSLKLHLVTVGGSAILSP